MPKFVSALAIQCAGPCQNPKPKTSIGEACKAESWAK